MGVALTPSPALILTKATREYWVPSPPSPQLRQRSQSAPEPHTLLTPSGVVFRCSRRNHPRSTSTKALEIASKRSQQKRGWPLACTRGLWQTSCEVLAEHWCWCSTIVPRMLLAFDARWCIGHRFLHPKFCRKLFQG